VFTSFVTDLAVRESPDGFLVRRKEKGVKVPEPDELARLRALAKKSAHSRDINLLITSLENTRVTDKNIIPHLYNAVRTYFTVPTPTVSYIWTIYIFRVDINEYYQHK
jgi:hypothetical protein